MEVKMKYNNTRFGNLAGNTEHAVNLVFTKQRKNIKQVQANVSHVMIRPNEIMS